MKIAVSYLSSDNYKECIKQIDNSLADYIHVDMCDGKYVDTKNFTVNEIVKLLGNTKKMLNIHLMVENPMKYIDSLAMLNTDTIIIHNVKNAKDIINYIKSLGLKAGIAINPDENINDFKIFFPYVDEVLIMSVYPGKGGQSFIKETITKIDDINNLKNNYNFITSVDGGINCETINLVKDKNIDLIVSGSYITNLDDYDEGIKTLKN